MELGKNSKLHFFRCVTTVLGGKTPNNDGGQKWGNQTGGQLLDDPHVQDSTKIQNKTMCLFEPASFGRIIPLHIGGKKERKKP